MIASRAGASPGSPGAFHAVPCAWRAGILGTGVSPFGEGPTCCLYFRDKVNPPLLGDSQGGPQVPGDKPCACPCLWRLGLRSARLDSASPGFRARSRLPLCAPVGGGVSDACRPLRSHILHSAPCHRAPGSLPASPYLYFSNSFLPDQADKKSVDLVLGSNSRSITHCVTLGQVLAPLSLSFLTCKWQTKVPTRRGTVRSISVRKWEDQWKTVQSAQMVTGASPGLTAAGGSETQPGLAPGAQSLAEETIHVYTSACTRACSCQPISLFHWLILLYVIPIGTTVPTLT